MSVHVAERVGIAVDTTTDTDIAAATDARVAAHVLEPDAGSIDSASMELAPWWRGLWFEGPFDPSGTAFAVLLAVAATGAMGVIATAMVRIATGA